LSVTCLDFFNDIIKEHTNDQLGKDVVRNIEVIQLFTRLHIMYIQGLVLVQSNVKMQDEWNGNVGFHLMLQS